MEIKQKLQALRTGKLTPKQNIKSFLKKIRKDDKKINSFIQINPQAEKQAAEVDKKLKAKRAGKLAGLAIAVKSCICTQGLLTSCGSKTLSNYIAPYNADVISRIKAEDGIIIGTTNMDEFACGSSGETSFYGPTDNPAARGKIPGGSSSGSAAAIAADFCDLALGSDTGGSIRNPASHCGIAGVKPTYGRVSRYGLIDMAMSLEQIGTLSRDVYGSALLLNIISGKSEKDATTLAEPSPKPNELKSPRKLTLGLSKDFEKLCTDKKIYKLIEKSAEKLASEHKWKIKQVNLKYVDLAIQTYYPIVYVEFFSSTRKYDGRRFGYRIEETCGEEVLRRILGGAEISKAEYRGKYYRRALAVRKLISEDFKKAFKKVDVLLSPTVPKLPHKIGTKITDPEVMYAYDAFTIPANLAGIPAGVVPASRLQNIPTGLQIMAPHFKEELLLKVMQSYEKL